MEYAASQSRANNDQDPLHATEKEIEELIIHNGMVIAHEFRRRVKHKGVVFCCEVKK